MKILFLAAEADPFVKIGGLGDVAGSLPLALRRLEAVSGHNGSSQIDIRLVIPFHGAIQRKSFPLRSLKTFNITSINTNLRVEVLATELHDLPVYLLTGEPIPPDSPVYTADTATDGYKFAFFSVAALELARSLDWVPDIIHANDWHTAPAVYALALRRNHDSFFAHTSSVLGLHNLAYLGVGAGPALASYGLPPATGSELPWWAQDMPLPLGLLSADQIVAASPTYAREILTPEGGSGLHEFLKSRAQSITGILNGINPDQWDPIHDPALVANYTPDYPEYRLKNKEALQAEFGLEVNARIPLLGMVTRMDPQKGIDLLPGALRQIEGIGSWQAIILGVGLPELETVARRLERDYPQRFRAVIRFDQLLSRRIFAGVDALLIPSRHEACGLTQMIAMHYGCVPIARSTGGLKDTIQDLDRSEDSTGFLFGEASERAFAGALRRAISLYHNQAAWKGLQRRGMSRDFSWDRSARQYLAVYNSLLDERRA